MNRRQFVAGLLMPVQRSVLVHEHVMVDFIGADQIKPGRYDVDEVFRAAKPRLEEIQRLGCRRLLECTPNFLGRDPKLLARLADAVGMEIWTNTGIYGSANHKYVPAFALTETAQQLSSRWINEAQHGVNGIRPRFIKTGVNKGPLDSLDRKLIQAAAITSRETGLTIQSHTGDGAAALEQLGVVTSEKVNPAKFVWVHAQNEKDHAIHEKIARAGAWVEFDGINEKSAAWHLECVRFMAGKNLLARTLISQDAGWYRVGEAGGGAYRGYTYIYTDLLPKLDPADVRVLMVENPVKAFE